MKKAFPIAALSVLLLTAGSPGIRPRSDASSYPAHQEQANLSIGAALIPHEQAKKMFTANLEHAGYMVVEVGVYPAPGKDVDLFPADFTLSVGEGAASLRPVDADTIAEIMTGSQKQPTKTYDPHGINTSTGISVGRVSYPDPATGRQTGGTVVTTSAGVGVGGPAPCPGYPCDTGSYPSSSGKSQTQAANDIAQDLWSKSLPDGKTSQPVAGYLFFPKPSHKAKDAALELWYNTDNGRVRLPLVKGK
ncbi:MAG TPA: hypothetical protein VKU01_06210 [Bryobacteraceae bacterium]|nr:hypothetical protein [Bryobacteraceae bacterium]